MRFEGTPKNNDQGRRGNKEEPGQKEGWNTPMNRRKFLELGGAALGVAAGGHLLLETEKEASANVARLEEQRRQELGRIIREEYGRPAEPGSERGRTGEKNDNIPDGKRPENMTPEIAACESILDSYYEIARSKDWPSDVFSDTYFMSVAAAEARGQKDARSPAGAVGWMQIMPSAVNEVGDYLATMKKKKYIEHGGPGKLKDKMVEGVIAASTVNTDYNRAIGKLYFMAMWDERFGRYNVGAGYDPKRFRNENDKQQAIAARQDDLAACYNMGPSRFRRKKFNNRFFGTKVEYPDETVAYIRRIRNNIADFGLVFAEMGRRGWARDNYLAFSIVNADDIARPGAERDFVRQELFAAVSGLVPPGGRADQSMVRDVIDKKTSQLEAFLADKRRKEKEAAKNKEQGKQTVAKK